MDAAADAAAADAAARRRTERPREDAMDDGTEGRREKPKKMKTD